MTMFYSYLDINIAIVGTSYKCCAKFTQSEVLQYSIMCQLVWIVNMKQKYETMNGSLHIPLTEFRRFYRLGSDLG